MARNVVSGGAGVSHLTTFERRQHLGNGSLPYHCRTILTASTRILGRAWRVWSIGVLGPEVKRCRASIEPFSRACGRKTAGCKDEIAKSCAPERRDRN